MNLFEQSLKELTLMLEDYLFSLKSLDKEFVYLWWSFNYLVLSEKASRIYDRINNLLRYLFILKFSYDGKFVYFIIEIKDKWKFYWGVKCGVRISYRHDWMWCSHWKILSLSSLQQIFLDSLWLNILANE